MNYYPKLQWSKFLDNDRNEQVVIRTDDLKEFKELKEAFSKKIEARQESEAIRPRLQAKCETCGAEMEYKSGVSKTGKKWEALFCPNADKNDKSTHKPIWL